MEFDALMPARRSVRFFTERKIDRAIIEKIIDAGRYAPRASNRQHWEAIVVDEKEVIERLYYDGGAQKTVLGAPAVIVIVVDMRFNVANYDNIQSTCAAAENMLLKITDIGLGGCWVVGFGSKENVRRILGIPDYFEPLCYLLVGEQNQKFKISSPPPKKALSEVVHYNKYAPKTLYLSSYIRPSKWTIEQIRDHQRFVSRARHLGIDYEFYSDEEIRAIKSIARQNVKDGDKVAVLLSYDGTVLKHIAGSLEKNEIVDFELHDDIINFVRYKTSKPKFMVYAAGPQEKFDAVILPFALEKVPRPYELVKEVEAMLKEGGRIISFDKNKNSFYGLMYFCLEKFLGIKKLEGFFVRSGPFEPISSIRLESKLRKAGLRVIESRGMFFLPPEVSIFTERLDGYLKRHGKKLSFLKHFMRFSLLASEFAFKITKQIKIKHLCSSTYIVAEKPAMASQKENVGEK